MSLKAVESKGKKHDCEARLVAAVSTIKDMYKRVLSLLEGIGCWTKINECFKTKKNETRIDATCFTVAKIMIDRYRYYIILQVLYNVYIMYIYIYIYHHIIYIYIYHSLV